MRVMPYRPPSVVRSRPLHAKEQPHFSRPEASIVISIARLEEVSEARLKAEVEAAEIIERFVPLTNTPVSNSMEYDPRTRVRGKVEEQNITYGSTFSFTKLIFWLIAFSLVILVWSLLISSKMGMERFISDPFGATQKALSGELTPVSSSKKKKERVIVEASGSGQVIKIEHIAEVVKSNIRITGTATNVSRSEIRSLKLKLTMKRGEYIIHSAEHHCCAEISDEQERIAIKTQTREGLSQNLKKPLLPGDTEKFQLLILKSDITLPRGDRLSEDNLPEIILEQGFWD